MWTVSQPRELVAQIFHIASLLLGIPSVVLFVYVAWGLVQVHFLRPPRVTPGSPTGNPIIDGLTAVAMFFAKGFSLFSSAMEWAMTAAVVVLFILSVFAAVLFVIGRGLHSGRAWARVSGVIVAFAPLLASILIMTSIRRPLPMAFGAIGTVLAGYAIWVLGWRFA